ncbi:sugar ABC transporter permease [Thermoclostridium stercorarium subsp. leptospartum DSM 9219]|uniref:Sugar ABC transporter permease n=1 Tax=Thermoclostridium stercorarium subsp. leptospartum DSM 9219 TaxID=1346611 RepID=A0A1B1YIP1_THEST|nr:carbohydrate ABC transporter permease [Thermoclostridium stercorarium]ANX00637.1 sugar ABC transporter permease [Thermoclostridium stercorarium subsp. leptospartum DSM 9219]
MGVKKRKKVDIENIIFTTLNTTYLIFLCVVMIYPMLNTLAVSFNEPLDTVRGGIYIWPRKFTLYNYYVVFNMDTIYNAFYISVTKTIVIVVTNLFFTSMLAYTISRKEYIFRKFITTVFVLTMYFNAGLIPNYLLIKKLGLLNTFSVYWIPNIVSAFNLIVMRTYIKTIPESLIESAKIDGAREFHIYWRIVLPLITPCLATIALFVAVGSWNSWFDTFLYNSARQDLSTLQYELQKLLSSTMTAGTRGAPAGINEAGRAGTSGTGSGNVTIPQSIRAAITIFTSVPILLVYPFLQRYFIHGLAIGSVKE